MAIHTYKLWQRYFKAIRGAFRRIYNSRDSWASATHGSTARGLITLCGACIDPHPRTKQKVAPEGDTDSIDCVWCLRQMDRNQSEEVDGG